MRSRLEKICVGAIFPALSATAFISMWATTASKLLPAFWQAEAKGAFPDGTPFRTSYTFIWPVDKYLSTLVAFFFPITNGKHDGCQSILVGLYCTLFSVTMIQNIESYRRGNRNTSLLSRPWVWGILYQLLGGGLVLPLWYAWQLKQPKLRGRDCAVPIHHAQVLPISLVLGAGVPTFLAYASPAAFTISDDHHQIMLAVHQLYPVYVSVIQYALGTIWGVVRGSGTKTQQHADLKFVRNACVFTLGITAAGYIFAAARVVKIGVAEVFLTDPRRLESMAELAVWFLQWDTVHIVGSLLLWSIVSMEGDAGVGVWAAVVVGSGVVGPGTVAMVLFLKREYALRGMARAKVH